MKSKITFLILSGLLAGGMGCIPPPKSYKTSERRTHHTQTTYPSSYKITSLTPYKSNGYNLVPYYSQQIMAPSSYYSYNHYYPTTSSPNISMTNVQSSVGSNHNTSNFLSFNPQIQQLHYTWPYAPHTEGLNVQNDSGIKEKPPKPDTKIPPNKVVPLPPKPAPHPNKPEIEGEKKIHQLKISPLKIKLPQFKIKIKDPQFDEKFITLYTSKEQEINIDAPIIPVYEPLKIDVGEVKVQGASATIPGNKYEIYQDALTVPDPLIQATTSVINMEKQKNPGGVEINLPPITIHPTPPNVYTTAPQIYEENKIINIAPTKINILKPDPVLDFTAKDGSKFDIVFPTIEIPSQEVIIDGPIIKLPQQMEGAASKDIVLEPIYMPVPLPEINISDQDIYVKQTVVTHPPPIINVSSASETISPQIINIAAPAVFVPAPAIEPITAEINSAAYNVDVPPSNVFIKAPTIIVPSATVEQESATQEFTLQPKINISQADIEVPPPIVSFYTHENSQPEATI